MLSCERVECHFGGVKAVDGIDFELQPGARCGIVGPNGSGKSTLLSVISGSLAPTAGVVKIGGRVLRPHIPETFARAGVGRTFQNLRLLDDLSIFDNVALGLSPKTRIALGVSFASRRRARRVVAEALETVELPVPAWRRVGELSYGQRKRVELARVVAWRPDILLLDEPTAGLPRGELFDFAAVLTRVAKMESAVVIVEHDLDLVAAVSEHLLFLSEGRVHARGDVDTVLDMPEVKETLGERSSHASLGE